MQVGGDQLIGSCTFPVMKVDKVMPKRPEWVTLWKKMESGSSAQGTISSAPEVRGEILISFQLIPIEEVLKVGLLAFTYPMPNAQCPMPNANAQSPTPMPNAQCPMPNAQYQLPQCPMPYP